MRTLLFVSLAFAACDNTNLNNNDDLSMSNDDLSTMPDQAGMIMDCDLVAQDCPSGQKCALTGGGGMTGQMPGCVTAGTVTEGQPCMRGMMGQPDNCAAGLVCPRTGGGGGGGGTSVCRKICTDDQGCSGGQQCAILSFNFTDVGQCTPTCTPFGTGCTGTQTCAGVTLAVGATQTNQVPLFTCRNAGTTGLYDDCQRASDCGANAYCDPNAMWCAPLCDSSHLCSANPTPDGGSVLSCQSFDSTLASDPGYCG